jgi:hypothetical protein
MDANEVKKLFEMGLTMVALKNLGGVATNDELKDRVWKHYGEAEDQFEFKKNMIELGLEIEAMTPTVQ